MDFLLRLNSALFFPSLELTLFNISADWDPVFKIYIEAIAWHRRESLAFITSMHYQGLIYYFVKYFFGIYLCLYKTKSSAMHISHVSLIFYCFLHGHNIYKRFIRYRKTPEKILYD